MSKVVSISGTAPLSLATVKEHLRISGSDEDTLIQIYIDAALAIAEQHLWRKLPLQTIEEVFTCFHNRFDLSYPINSITSIKYFDESEVEQTLTVADYYEIYDNAKQKNSIYKVGTLETPSFWLDKAFPVEVTYTTGFEDDTVPKPIINAMLLLIGDMYENREDTEYKSSIRKASALAMNPWRLKKY